MKTKKFTFNYINEPEHNLVVDVEIEIKGEEKTWNGYNFGSSHGPMRCIPINFWYIENGVKEEENYYNDNNLAAIIIKEDGMYWTNDIEEAFHNGRMWKIEKI